MPAKYSSKLHRNKKNHRQKRKKKVDKAAEKAAEKMEKITGGMGNIPGLGGLLG